MSAQRIASALIGAQIVLAASFGIAGTTGAIGHGTAFAAPNTSVCEYEDGNSDGSPCNWQDSDTGRWYANDSANYRDKGR